MKWLNGNRITLVLVGFVATFACATSEPAMAQLPDVSQHYTIQGIEPPKGATDIAWFLVNDAGLAVAQYTAWEKTHTGLLERGTWTVIDVPGSAKCLCSNPSASGQVPLCFAHTDGVWHSAIYHQGTYQYLPDHPVHQYVLQYMSDDGLLMTGAIFPPNQPGVCRGLVLNASLSLFKIFDFPGSKSTVPMGINNAGLIVGGYQVGGFNIGPGRGFLYDGNDFTDIQVPEASNTCCFSINNNGDIVGGYDPNGSPGVPWGFILHKGEWKRFTVPGSSWNGVQVITDRGQLSGVYSDQNGRSHGYIATPRVELNYDGKVDIKDLLILIEHWGQNYPLCDIGPMPWGDGKIDANDLEVLMRYWGQDMDLLSPSLMAHWRLDETEGAVARDSLGRNDATLNGNPLWQPEGGQVGGALQFDGVDDYVTTPFIVNPADGPFSVFVWVKGGAPGQVVLSEADGANWLCTDSGEGKLMTELKAQSRHAAAPLLSQAVITGDTWHRIGLVWSGTRRSLYVDGQEVASDASDFGRISASGGLHLGAGSTLGPGTFWSGLIDDVHIYNSVVYP